MVIDCGLARVPRYEPDVGLTRLETVRVSRASADQRRGRAGRTEPGVCYRLWDEPQTAALEPAHRPEILAADLSGFVLDLASWGVADPASLAFLDPPPAPALAEAQDVARRAGCDRPRRTHHRGRAKAATAAAAAAAGAHGGRCRRPSAKPGLPPRSPLLLTERGLGGNDVDLAHRIDGLRRDRSQRAQDARAMATRWASIADAHRRQPERHRSNGTAKSCRSASLLALAYPERIAKNRGAGGCVPVGQWSWRQHRSGVGAGARAVSRRRRDCRHAPRRAASCWRRRSRSAARSRRSCPIASKAARRSSSIEQRRACARAVSAVLARSCWPSSRCRWCRPRRPRASWPKVSRGSASTGCHGPRRCGNGATGSTFCAALEGDEWPDLSDAALAASRRIGLCRRLPARPRCPSLARDELAEALRLAAVELAPPARCRGAHPFRAPSGSLVPIDYEAEEGPKIAVRVQELFGLDRHPDHCRRTSRRCWSSCCRRRSGRCR